MNKIKLVSIIDEEIASLICVTTHPLQHTEAQYWAAQGRIASYKHIRLLLEELDNE